MVRDEEHPASAPLSLSRWSFAAGAVGEAMKAVKL
jgi:hypothetical protein